MAIEIAAGREPLRSQNEILLPPQTQGLGQSGIPPEHQDVLDLSFTYRLSELHAGLVLLGGRNGAGAGMRLLADLVLALEVVADAGRGAGLVADAGGLVDNGIGAGAFGHIGGLLVIHVDFLTFLVDDEHYRYNVVASCTDTSIANLQDLSSPYTISL